MILLQSVKGYKLFYSRGNDCGRRLDRVVKKMLPDVPSGLIYAGIRKGLIRVNGKKSSQSYRLEEYDVIAVRESITFSSEPGKPAEPDAAKTARLAELTVKKTENLIFLNKPRGMLTHGENSLAELISEGLTGAEHSLSFSPAPLHRLDRNTSGLIAASVTISGAARFSELMRRRTLNKYYLGLCSGGPGSEVRLEDSLARTGNVTRKSTSGSFKNSGGPRTGITTAVPLLSDGNFTLCLFRIETGLTHQIRSQAAAAGFPLAGDVKYGGGISGFRGYILHSWVIALEDFDDICGFRTVSAELQHSELKTISSFFGKNRLVETLENVKNELFN